MLTKEIDFSPLYITGRNKLYRHSSCSLTILGYNGNILKQKSNIQQKKFNNLLKGKKPEHYREKIIFNNTSYFLLEAERSLLLKGSNFTIPPKNLIMLITESNLNYFT